MIENALKMLVLGEDLDISTAKTCMAEMMNGVATQIQMAAFLTAIKMKIETVEELYSFASVMRENAAKVVVSEDIPLVDTCGTGGDGIHTFNISTTAMFIAAGAGVKIAKHGNRSITSKCGAADVLESLGAVVELSPSKVAACIRDSGIGFMFAPSFHASMKHVAPVRKELGFRTAFNILGPLANPASAKRQLLGVFEKGLIGKMAHVLKELGVDRAMVVHGEDGMDEITLTGKTYVAELSGGKVLEYQIDPRNYGFELCKVEELKGGDAKLNAEIIRNILNGVEGPKSDVAILNAGAVLYVSGLVNSLEEGLSKARESISNGKAAKSLEAFLRCSRKGEGDDT